MPAPGARMTAVGTTARAASADGTLLLGGLNHVAVLTQDADRLHAFYRDVFGARVFAQEEVDGMRVSLVDVGGSSRLHVFEVKEGQQRTPMFARGPIDHLGLEAASQQAFDEIRTRLVQRGASDGFVTDFGTDLSVFFIDPDGLECEVLLNRPDAEPHHLRPPGTPAEGYER